MRFLIGLLLLFSIAIAQESTQPQTTITIPLDKLAQLRSQLSATLEAERLRDFARVEYEAKQNAWRAETNAWLLLQFKLAHELQVPPAGWVINLEKGVFERKAEPSSQSPETQRPPVQPSTKEAPKPPQLDGSKPRPPPPPASNRSHP